MKQLVKSVPSISTASATVLRKNPRSQRGASLLEAIAYLGIAAIVVIGAVALLNGAFSSAGSNELSEQVSAIQTGVKKLYMGQTGGYTGISNTILSSAGVFPSTIPVNAGAATNTWGGSVTVASPSVGTFTIAYTQVPTSVCINAATAGGSWNSLSINGTPTTTVPATPTEAQTDCSAGNANTMTWTSN
jgi:X-X-X-Leu-X-X-Gly heptad repeat protein